MQNWRKLTSKNRISKFSSTVGHRLLTKITLGLSYLCKDVGIAGGGLSIGTSVKGDCDSLGDCGSFPRRLGNGGGAPVEAGRFDSDDSSNMSCVWLGFEGSNFHTAIGIFTSSAFDSSMAVSRADALSKTIPASWRPSYVLSKRKRTVSKFLRSKMG